MVPKRPCADGGDSTSPTTFLGPSEQQESLVHSKKVSRIEQPSSAEMESNSEHPPTQIFCELPPHFGQHKFSTIDEYEVHYKKSHLNRCADCHINLPSEHFLNLHIAENHDPLVQVRRERGEKTYACFEESCKKVCMAPHKRRRHMIDKHQFPPSYDFFIVNDGIDGKNSMLRTDRVYQKHKEKSMKKHAESTPSVNDHSTPNSRQSEDAMDLEKNSESTEKSSDASAGENDTNAESQNSRRGEHNASTSQDKESSQDVDQLTELVTSMKALKMVPRNVRFGKKQGWRSGFARS